MRPTAAQYEQAFKLECAQSYPEIDKFTAQFPIDRDRLEGAARVLACPVKKNPPNWQHGRVIYQVVREYAARTKREKKPAFFLDIGTAKGFSALCALWAAKDSQFPVRIVSLDVIDPEGIESRNTVAEVDSPKTLHEILVHWPESRLIEFKKSKGVDFLSDLNERIHFAFVDGKHTFEAVKAEGYLIGQRQVTGDMIVFDDVQIEGVGQAVSMLKNYTVRWLEAKKGRAYAIAERD